MMVYKIRICNCGSGKESYFIYDGRGIPLGRVCQSCEQTKRSKFRPEVLTDSDYECNEQIDED